MKTGKVMAVAGGVAALIFWSGSVFATVESANSGNWDDDATWVGDAPTASDDVVIKADHTVTIRNHTTIHINSLTIEDGGTLTHLANSTTAAGEQYKIILDITGNLTLEPEGKINVDGKGYQNAHGPGGRPTINAGGTHGGVGGDRGGTTESSLITYGSIIAPTNIGSGGNSSAGGGSAQLTVTGTTTLYGTISASGAGGLDTGAGGSVFLTTGTLIGSGSIRADGGLNTHGATSISSGGGGRIAVVLTNSTDFGAIIDNIQAHAGGVSGASSRGAPGTIYLRTQSQGPDEGLLIIDAGNLTATPYTLIGSQVNDTVVGSVVITNTAKLAITNQTLTVHGDWQKTANSTFTALADSTVDFAGPAPATVQGDNTFYNLTAGAQDKTIEFEAGKTNIVNAKLTLRNRTTLLSTEDGVWTYLALSPGGTQEIAAVRVKDNHAGLHDGQEIMAGLGSLDLKNNVNWWFPPRGTLFLIR